MALYSTRRRALSGGGIRSSAFCLGSMQALDTRGFIDKIDYLSTVSGGGYIGTSMTAKAPAPPACATTQGQTGQPCFGAAAPFPAQEPGRSAQGSRSGASHSTSIATNGWTSESVTTAISACAACSNASAGVAPHPRTPTSAPWGKAPIRPRSRSMQRTHSCAQPMLADVDKIVTLHRRAGFRTRLHPLLRRHNRK